LLDPLLQIEAYEARVCAILLLAAEAVGEDAKEGGEGGMAEAMMKNGVLLGRLSRAHCQLVLLKKFHEAVAQQEERLAGGGGGKEGGKEGEEEEEGGVVTVGPAEVRVLRELCHLFALSGMEREMADFRARDYLSSRQAEMVGREVGRLNRVVRVEAVSLVDAWMMSDKLLGSALGRRDGRVYGALFEEALRSPLNEREVSEAYELHWKRLLLAGGGGGWSRDPPGGFGTRNLPEIFREVQVAEKKFRTPLDNLNFSIYMPTFKDFYCMLGRPKKIQT